MKIEWRRGFFRLWLVGSVLWICGVTAIAWNSKDIPSLSQGCTQLLTFKTESGEFLGASDVAKCEVLWQKERIELAIKAFAPPTALIVFGALFGWIATGFRRKEQSFHEKA